MVFPAAALSSKPHARLVEIGRQGESLGDLRVRPVEGRVEARDLRKVRRAVHQHGDGGQVVGLVQGSERVEALQILEHARIHSHGGRVVETAVDDPVAHADELVLLELLSQEPPQMLHRPGVAEGRARLPCPLGHDPARRILGHEAGRRVDAFELPPDIEGEIAVAHGEERELDARRPRVDDDDGVGHGVLSAARPQTARSAGHSPRAP